MMLNLILGVRFPDQDRQDVFQVPQVAQVLGKVKTIYQKHQLGSNVWHADLKQNKYLKERWCPVWGL